MSFNFGWVPLIQQSLRRFFATAAQGTKADSAIQPSAVGTSVQAYSSNLSAIAALTSGGALTRVGSTWVIVPVNALQQGRLTPSSSDPDINTEGSPSSSIYFLPYKGNQISLYDGTSWVPHTFTTQSLALSGVDVVHDIFAYLNGSNVELDSTTWIDWQNRSTGLIRQDGVLVKAGNPEQKYLGTVMTNASQVLQYDESRKLVWNYYNQTPKDLARQFSGGTHSYSSTTLRFLGNDNTQDLRMVCGVQQSSLITIRADAGNRTVIRPGVNYNQPYGLALPLLVEQVLTGGDLLNSTINGQQAFSLEPGFNFIHLLEASLTGDAISVSKTIQTGLSMTWMC